MIFQSRNVRGVLIGLSLWLLTSCQLVDVVKYEVLTKVTKYPDRIDSPRIWNVAESELSLEKNQLDQVGFLSTLVFKEDEIIFEWYADGYSAQSDFNIKSVSKSLFSAVAGIAISEERLQLHKPISQIGGCEVPKLLQPLTAEHLLNMSAGFHFKENENMQIYANEKWSCGILASPIEAKNGARFNYGTVQSYLLGAVLEEAELNEDPDSDTTSLKNYFDQKLLDPLEISLNGWRLSPEGIPFAGSDMRFTARDLLAFGKLYLDDGKYKNKQIVPKRWIEKSNEVVWPSAIKDYGYGWYWWKTEIANRNFLAALGFGGQTLFIDEEHGMLVVTTAPLDNHDNRMDYLRILIEDIVSLTSRR